MKAKIYRFLFTIVVIFNGLQQSQAQVSATVEFACFPSENGLGRLLLIIGVDGRSLVVKKLANRKFQTTATFAIVVNDSLKNYFAEKVDFQSPEFSDSLQLNQIFTTTKTIALPAGKFKLELLTYDPASKDTSREKATIPILMPGEKPNVLISSNKRNTLLSDLLLLNSNQFDLQKSIFDQNANIFRLSNFYSGADSLLSFYGECIGIHMDYPKGLTLVSRLRIQDLSSKISLDEFGKIKRIKSKAVIASKFDLNIKNLPTGNYLIMWDIIDSAGKVVVRTQKAIIKSNPELKKELTSNYVNGNTSMINAVSQLSIREARHIVASMQPIANKSEQSTIEYLQKKGEERELKNYLVSFWSKKEIENPVAAFQSFRNLVSIADKRYATKVMPAFQTDRGRVFLQYGEPNIIENENSDRFRSAMKNLNTVPYEVWYYYSLKTPVKQNDVIFAFIQENRGNDNYRLLHSTGIGEVRNKEWRKAVENNATYNYDRLDPNDRYDKNDVQKFR